MPEVMFSFGAHSGFHIDPFLWAKHEVELHPILFLSIFEDVRPVFMHKQVV